MRYNNGELPTRYTYTGQYTHADTFGLLFYNARYYSPALGRFVSADTIIPPGVQGLDRYAYVNNSPIVYKDPSGYDPDGAECYNIPSEEGRKACLAGHNNTPPPQPDNLDLDKLTFTGKKLYDLYKKLYADTSGWWWEIFGKDGQFSIWEFMGIIWGYELGVVVTNIKNYTEGFVGYAEALARASREYCKVMNCDPSSAEGQLNFIGNYSQSARSRAYSNKTISDVFNKPENMLQPLAGLDIVMAIRNPIYFRAPQWGEGFKWDRPYAVGNLSMLNPDMKEIILEHQWWWFASNGWQTDPNPAFVFTGCQILYINGQGGCPPPGH